MLDQAFAPQQRKENGILKQRADVEKSQSSDLLVHLYDNLHRHISNSDVLKLLRENYAFKPGIRNEIYGHYNVQLKSLKEKASDDEWEEFQDEVREVAERLWRDEFLRLTSNQDMNTEMNNHESGRFRALQLSCNISKLLLVLWLDGRLYRYRADVNARAFQLQPNQDQGARATKRAIHDAIRKPISDYKRVLRDWNRELRKVTGRSLFIERYADAQRFRTLGKEFLAFSSGGEAGWAAQSDDAYAEVRYQLFEELRKGSLTMVGLPVAGLFYLLRLTTGYGMKPMRFVWTGAITIAAFAVLFLSNDFFNPGIGAARHFCPQASVDNLPWYAFPVRYFYLSVTNLSSLGSDPSIAQYCGGMATQILLAACALTGYFLLAMLAALIFKLLTEAV